MISRKNNGSSLDTTNTTSNTTVDATSNTATHNGCGDVTEYNESDNNSQSKQSIVINILDYLMKDNSYLMYDIFA